MKPLKAIYRLLKAIGARLLELISNADGTLSRTQVSMWLFSLTCCWLIICEAHLKNIINTPLIIVLIIYGISSHLDRMEARRFSLKVGRGGAELTVNGTVNGTVGGQQSEEG